MCGIAGFSGSGDLEDITFMTEALAHRGPDGSGIESLSGGRVHFGHRRLAIIDLEGGAQPMSDSQSEVWVTFNGEIYNHQSLRQELEAHGHVFQTHHSDTEVLIHGWRQWRQALPQKLDGMFAFAIWDSTRDTLFLARDRSGEKPLYWALQGDLFLFASELTAIEAHPQFRSSIDHLSVQKYIAHGYVPAPHSLLKNTYKLRPGHHLTWQPGAASPHVSSYWTYKIDPDPNPPSIEDATAEVRRLLGASVKKRLMSDVPLGVFLSGGIDSSATAALAAEVVGPSQVETFTIGFREKSFDESGHARFVAESLGCKNHNKILEMHEVQPLIETIVSAIDEPIADPSILPTYLLSSFTSRSVKVALSGDGGDELFAGYDPFVALKPAKLYQAVVPRFFHQFLMSASSRLPRSERNMSLDFKIRRTLRGLMQDPALWNPTWLGPISIDMMAEFFSDPASPEEIFEDVYTAWNANPELSVENRTLEYYFNFYLSNNINVKVDRASMQAGLEVRSIFLDADLVDFVRKLPFSYKMKGLNRKRVLKSGVRELVPPEIINRPKKGFGIPLVRWMRDFTIDTGFSEPLGIRRPAIDQAIVDDETGQSDHRLLLWAMIAFQQSTQDRGLL